MDDVIQYHLRELQTAQDDKSPEHYLPGKALIEQAQAVLDIGCGVGQTLLTMEKPAAEDALLVGIDIDLAPLQYGVKHYENIKYVNSPGEILPFADNTFDLVISRVSLPYTNIPKCLREVNRTLKPGGKVWLSLHSFGMQRRHLSKSITSFAIKDIIFRSYVLLNGTALHLFGVTFPFPGLSRCESCQSERGMSLALKKAGFDNIEFDRTYSFIVIAEKSAG